MSDYYLMMFAHIMAYMITTTTVGLSVLGLCKFFYVQPLHDWFDELDSSFSGDLIGIIAVLILSSVIYDVCIIMDWIPAIVFTSILVVFMNLAIIIFVLAPIYGILYDALDDLHERIKYKKTKD